MATIRNDKTIGLPYSLKGKAKSGFIHTKPVVPVKIQVFWCNHISQVCPGILFKPDKLLQTTLSSSCLTIDELQKKFRPHDCFTLLPVIDGGTANMAEIKGTEPLQGDQPSGSGI